eukprot:6480697-Amphidinium_carterae.2
MCALFDLTPAPGVEQEQFAEFERRASLVSPHSQTSAWTRFGLLLHGTVMNIALDLNLTDYIYDNVPWRPNVAPPPPPVR